LRAFPLAALAGAGLRALPAPPALARGFGDGLELPGAVPCGGGCGGGGCRDDGNLAAGWYRFMYGGFDAIMPDGSTNVDFAWNHCGTERGGRLRGVVGGPLDGRNPTIDSGIVSMYVDFPYGTAGTLLSINVVNCGDFFLYQHIPFVSPSSGGLGGCTGAPFGYCITQIP
jgi:hypothetical protein